MELHPACEPLAFLLGTWKGAGEGHYPTIEPFRYNEEVSFGQVGKPFLTYTQKTRHADTGAPLHAETGYLRAVGGQNVEFIVVQPSGIIEMHHGVVQDMTLELELDSVHVTATAKSVTDVKRRFQVKHDSDGAAVLECDLWMAAVGQSMTHHLRAALVRQQSD